MGPQEFNANIDSVDHIKKVDLEYERLPRVVKHPRRMVQLLEKLQMTADIFHKGKQVVLY